MPLAMNPLAICSLDDARDAAPQQLPLQGQLQRQRLGADVRPAGVPWDWNALKGSLPGGFTCRRQEQFLSYMGMYS